MPVSKTVLKSAIKAAFDNEKTQTDGQDASIDRIATAISDAVANAIVQGVNTATVAAVLTSPSGAVTGNITITASAV